MTGGAPPPQGKLSRLLRERADGNFARLGDDEYLRVRKLLSESAGMVYDEKRREVLRLHLRDRAIAVGCETFAEYVDLATSDRSELQSLWNQVAIHQTDFFRNRPQFEGLRRNVLPEVIRQADSRKGLTLWSAGCSSGEEPYSLAIAVLEALGDEASSWNVTVAATDISTEILERARSGCYEERHLSGVPDAIRRRWFRQDGDIYRVNPLLCEIVNFMPHNLSADPPPIVGLGDIVFCCNVTIYFSKDALHRAIRSLEAALRPGGYLFLGHSESLWRQPHSLELVDLGTSFAYRKPYEGQVSGAVLSAASSCTDVEADALAPSRKVSTANRTPEHQSAKVQVSDLSEEDSVWGGRSLGESGVTRTTVEAPETAITAGNDFESAEAEIASLRESSSPLGHGELAEVVATAQGHLERGQVEEVARLVSVAIEKAPTEASLHFLMGTAEQRLGDDDQALESFGRAVYCDPEFSLAYFYRATLYEALGKREQALIDYRNALRYLEADNEGKWDGYLESMRHDALVQLCEGKVRQLEGGTLR